MTNQEAISVLESINAKTDYYLINDDARAEAIDMAISALQEQELKQELKQEVKNSKESSLTQKGLDTISRTAAIDAIVKWAEDHNENPDGDDCIMILRELPTAQPETATVIIRCSTGGLTMWYACDACGVSIDYKDRYCRNCGRKLKHEI